MFNIKKLNFANYCKDILLAVFVASIFDMANAAEAVIGIAPTVLVESSSEVIASNLVISNLPKTISLGWETTAEILELKRQLVEYNLIGPKSCMSWLYIRVGEQTRLFMLNLVGSGIVRVNNESYESRYLGSYLTATPVVANLNEGIRGRGLIPDTRKRISLQLGLETIFKSSKNTTCTFTNVKCRRYEFKEFPITFSIPVEKSDLERAVNTRLIVNSAIKVPVSYFAEDMCPKTSKALIETSARLRLGDTGEFINSLSGGIPFNRDVKKALVEDLKK